jgi:hypothetical protein
MSTARLGPSAFQKTICPGGDRVDLQSSATYRPSCPNVFASLYQNSMVALHGLGSLPFAVAIWWSPLGLYAVKFWSLNCWRKNTRCNSAAVVTGAEAYRPKSCRARTRETSSTTDIKLVVPPPNNQIISQIIYSSTA